MKIRAKVVHRIESDGCTSIQMEASTKSALVRVLLSTDSSPESASWAIGQEFYIELTPVVH